MTRYARELRKVEGEAQAQRLISLYRNAETDVVSRLQRMVDKYGTDAKKKPSVRLLRQQYKAIRQELKRLDADGKKEASEMVKTTYTGGFSVARKQLKDAGLVNDMKAELSGIHKKALAVYSEQVQSRLSDMVTVAGRTVGDIYKQLQLNTVMVGTVAGTQTLKHVQDKMMRLAEKGGLISFIDSAGRSWNMGSYVEMLSRTTLMQVHNAATWNEFAEHGEDLIQISYHTPTCEMCAPWNGKVLSLTGKTPGYPTLAEAEGAGLFHPNCRHASSLFLEGVDSKEQALPEWMRGGAADKARGHLEPGELTADVIKADFKRTGQTISDAEAKQIRQDIYDYTTEGGGYGKIRAAQQLDDTKSPYYQKGERIEEWLHVAPVYPPHKDLYRGVSGDAAYKIMNQLQVGDNYQEGALSSASSKLRVANEFSKQKANERSVVVVIQGGLPYGASIRGCSENIDEYEVLVNKNAVFEIVRKEERRIFKEDKGKSLVFVVRYKQEKQ